MAIELTELPLEILLRIWSFLSIRDLLILSDGNRRLRDSVKADSRIDFKNTRIYLRYFDLSTSYVEEYPSMVQLCGISLILKYLRLFGEKIDYLVFDCEGAQAEQIHTVYKYVNRYCMNINHLVLGNMDFGLGRTLKKPLKTVKTLWIVDCKIDSRLCDLSKWFPQLQELDLFEKNEFKKISEVLKKYDSLKEININSNSMNEEEVNLFRSENPHVFIRYPLYFFERNAYPPP